MQKAIKINSGNNIGIIIVAFTLAVLAMPSEAIADPTNITSGLTSIQSDVTPDLSSSGS